MNNHKYLLILASEIDKLDFSQLVINSKETLIFNNDASKTFIEWVTIDPNFIRQLSWTEGPYNQEEMLYILKTDAWHKDEAVTQWKPAQSQDS